MIAQSLPYLEPEPDEFPQPRTGSRAGRSAVDRRRALRRRARYRLLSRIVTALTIATFCVGTYLALMANVTRMNYELGTNAKREAVLTDESARLDDEIERLASRERLAAIGAKLGMHQASNFAQITVPPERRADTSAGIAFLPWLK